jgi:prolyl-tRNA synthetase
LNSRVYEELLAIPVVGGKKTEDEKVAGGDYMTTVEAYISATGRDIQGATSHHLGQNFSKMLDITFESPQTGENSWGIATRTIRMLVMVHGDNNGLVLPPRMACLQVVIFPCGITKNLKDEGRNALYNECKQYEKELKEAGVRVKADLRENYSPGWKNNHWELRGVPIRVEVGLMDMKNSQYVAVRRDNLEKLSMKKSGLKDDTPDLLQTMFAKSKNEMTEGVNVVTNFEDFLDGLENKYLPQALFCGVEYCKDQIKKLSKKNSDLEPNDPSMEAKSLYIPLTQLVMYKDECIRPDNATEHTLQWTRDMFEGQITQGPQYVVEPQIKKETVATSDTLQLIEEDPYNCNGCVAWSNTSSVQVTQLYLFADFSDFLFSGNFHW